MLKYIYGDEMDQFPKLRDGMFRDRASQFRERLNWDVSVDEHGFERDEYDEINPLYVIWQRADGSHGGSMRVLPTTGPTMVNDHFRHLTDGVRIESPLIWESTRFCLAPDADANVAGALMLAGMEIGLSFYLDHAVGVFDHRMIRVYRHLGWTPTVVGTEGRGREAVSVGLWEFSDALRERLCRRSGIPSELSRHWFDTAFGPQQALAEVG